MTHSMIGSTELTSPQGLSLPDPDALDAFGTGTPVGKDDGSSYGVDRLMDELGRDLGDRFGRRRGRALPLKVALVDRFKLSRDCLVQISSELDQPVDMVAFATVEECVGVETRELDLLVYNHHSGLELAGALAAISEALPEVPVIVLSETDGERDGIDALAALKAGARGFIPTRTTGISMLSAAIGVVVAGGTFAPLELLMSPMREEAPASEVAMPAVPAENPVLSRLTARQKAVLGLIRQGKANKIIAHELKMSESTVKVHVRNVLRKMGATNRTQAAYNAQRM